MIFFAKNSATNANEANFKTVEGTGNLTGNKLRYQISKFSKSTKQNNFDSETEIPKERFIHPEERQQIINKSNIII